jgi:glycosyltransferase involved in cell wall biosynthesis
VLPRIPKALLTFRHLRLVADAECVVYSGFYAPLAVRSQQHGRKVMYCHTPPRFAFDWEEQYLRRVSPGLRPLLRGVIGRYRESYLEALAGMQVLVTNSEHVRRRTRDLTGRDSTVVYPPVATDLFRWSGQRDYYLSLGRLEPNKRVDRVIEAFRTMPDKQLVVASGGSELARLRQLAAGAGNILFTGWIDDAALAELIGHALACIYIPKDEDFGMSAVEAMAAGKPVIGVDEGGLRESILHGKTGLLLAADPSADEVAEAVRTLTDECAMGMRSACEACAAKFSSHRFLKSMAQLTGLTQETVEQPITGY